MLVLLLLLCYTHVCSQTKTNKTTRTISQDTSSLAKHDFNSNSARYYMFGIVAPHQQTIARFKKYHVSVVSKGCTSNPFYEEYNCGATKVSGYAQEVIAEFCIK